MKYVPKHLGYLVPLVSLTTLVNAQTDEALHARAEAIHAQVITIDSHDDIPFDFATEAVDPLDAPRQVNLEKMGSGGLDVGFFIVYVGQTERTPENYEQAKTDPMTKFNAIHRMSEMYPELIEIAHSEKEKSFRIVFFY